MADKHFPKARSQQPRRHHSHIYNLSLRKSTKLEFIIKSDNFPMSFNSPAELGKATIRWRERCQEKQFGEEENLEWISRVIAATQMSCRWCPWKHGIWHSSVIKNSCMVSVLLTAELDKTLDDFASKFFQVLHWSPFGKHPYLLLRITTTCLYLFWLKEHDVILLDILLDASLLHISVHLRDTF